MKLPARANAQRLFFQRIAAATATALLVLLCAINLQSQRSKSREVTLTTSATDYAAVAQAKNLKIHARPANTPIGRTTSAAAISSSPSVSVRASGTAAPDSGGPRFPADLQYLGGATVTSMQQVAIYMNPNGACNIAGCWGDPEGFLSDLGMSDFIHVVDQYTGSTANDRYTVSNTHVTINYHPNAKPFTDADMLAVVHAVALALGTPDGYSHRAYPARGL